MPDGKELPKNSKMMMNAAPEGFKLVKVKIGLSNENYVEILEGISEGDVVKVTSAEMATGTQSPGMGGMPTGGMGGMGGIHSGGMGGMPTGGMPPMGR